MAQRVYAVHTVRQGGGIGAVEMIFEGEQEALTYAKGRSCDPRFWSASVTCYHVGTFGSRRPVAWFVDGEPQNPRAHRPYYGTDGPIEGAAG